MPELSADVGAPSCTERGRRQAARAVDAQQREAVALSSAMRLGVAMAGDR